MLKLRSCNRVNSMIKSLCLCIEIVLLETSSLKNTAAKHKAHQNMKSDNSLFAHFHLFLNPGFARFILDEEIFKIY